MNRVNSFGQEYLRQYGILQRIYVRMNDVWLFFPNK